MALRVMIVDDEKDVHTYLKQIVDWEGKNLDLVCEAEDMVTARELFALHQPQIVFMDVCIPNFEEKTGLDIAREFCEIDKDTQVIVITGYADFSYAQQALSVGAVDLLLKPLQPTEVNRSLEKSIAFFEEKKQRLLSQMAMQHLVNENADFLRSRKIAQLLENTEESTHEQIAEQLQILSLDILGDKYIAVQMLLKKAKEDGGEIPKIDQMAVKKLCGQILLDHGYKAYVYSPGENVLSCVISWCENIRKNILEELLNKISQDVLLCFNLDLSVGMGTPVSNLRELSASFCQAQISLTMEETSYQNAQRNHYVALAQKYIDENLSNPSLGFDDVCSYIGISKIYFGRLFLKEVGISLGTYINQKRVEAAKGILKKTNLRVAEVAEQIGFTNTKYFSVVFKSTTGMTPLDYRRTKRFI